MENNILIEAQQFVEICSSTTPEVGHEALLNSLHNYFPYLQFHLVLSRGGWHRLGGIVNKEKQSVTRNIIEWAEQEGESDVDILLDKYADKELLVTRLNGETHYFVAKTGERACDFIQLEVEELQEVLERELVDSETPPNDLQELIDPDDYHRLEPEPVGQAFYLFRRVSSIETFFNQNDVAEEPLTPIQRFMQDWDKSSVGGLEKFSDHWVLVLREYIDGYGEPVHKAKPVSTYTGEVPFLDSKDFVRGAKLANLIRDFDHTIGYPMAWYFFMLTHSHVSHQLAEAINADLMGAYDYLPAQDLKILRGWSRQPYGL